MKKTITFITAMLIAATALTGCSSSSKGDNTSNKPKGSNNSEQSTDAPTETEKEVIDPFENITYTISEESNYPNDCEIIFDASETPLGKELSFTYNIESANEKEIIIKANANTDDSKITQFLDENNYTIEENEKTFSINVEDLKTNFISADYISGDNKAKIISAMQNFIDSAFIVSEDAEYENIFDDLGFDSNNPDYLAEIEAEKEEFEKEKAESQTRTFELIKLYAVFPKEIKYNYSPQRVDSIGVHKAKVGISSDIFEQRSGIFGIFKSNDNKYYCVDYESPVFNKAIIEESEYPCSILSILVEENGDLYEKKEYLSENEAYDARFHKYDRPSTETTNVDFKIIDIPLN